VLLECLNVTHRSDIIHCSELRVAQFVGQSGSSSSGKSGSRRGQTQKEQEEVLRAFNRGTYNVLVATCIAEEGLDIAEVDLIVSFDVTQSPVRMLQRNGRTARKKSGRVVMLVTEGNMNTELFVSCQ
jgi:ERCC4-related helicase